MEDISAAVVQNPTEHGYLANNKRPRIEPCRSIQYFL